ncbi:hypothetical protein TSMEX_010919 [Taenia solium]|eukprot:TsM_000156000 transcript=TsM_000156000 gene=TsM_000156000
MRICCTECYAGLMALQEDMRSNIDGWHGDDVLPSSSVLLQEYTTHGYITSVGAQFKRWSIWFEARETGKTSGNFDDSMAELAVQIMWFTAIETFILWGR